MPVAGHKGSGPTDPPASHDLYFRRIRAEGFDLYLEARQRIWPKTLELSVRRRRINAYGNGLAWIS